jgi:hypothetical protein
VTPGLLSERNSPVQLADHDGDAAMMARPGGSLVVYLNTFRWSLTMAMGVFQLRAFSMAKDTHRLTCD